jgi:hypothetical protein
MIQNSGFSEGVDGNKMHKFNDIKSKNNSYVNELNNSDKKNIGEHDRTSLGFKYV